MTLFDILMQNFYKVSYENNEKVPSFATRLEGTTIPNSAAMPMEDYGSGGTTACQGWPLPQSKETTATPSTTCSLPLVYCTLS